MLHKCDGLVGVGHGAPFVDMEGKMRYVFHAHKSESEIHPRNSFVVDMFVKDSIWHDWQRYTLRPDHGLEFFTESAYTT